MINQGCPLLLCGDALRLRQILTNLISNAVKFTERGFVSIELSGFSEDGLAYLSLAVKDSGIGIPEDKVASLFQLFT